jgi:hypothetical protein
MLCQVKTSGNAIKKAGRSAMITSLEQPAKCIRCGGRLSAPDKCSYVDEEFVCYHWICPKCGCEFESSICLYQDAPMTPELVEEFLPNLLIA